MLNIIRAPDRQGYDYVIIGAGSAGCVVAARLAENPSLRVLLIEAGGTDRAIGIAMPAAMGLPLMSDRTNYKYIGHLESNGTGIYQPRGRGLGGSSSVNGMNWMRGNRQDYDGWADLGIDGWSYDQVLPHFRRAETFAEGENAFRGGDGPVKVERAAADNPLFQAFLAAGAEAGIPENPDHNATSQIGMHRIQRNIGDGRRYSASYAYLHNRPKRPNLHILLDTRVTRLTLQAKRCVAITALRHGQTLHIPVGREAILCAGALISPQILMLSGIGDADHLRALDIPIAAHLPAVGQGLSDHTCLAFQYEVKDARDSQAHLLSMVGRAKVGLEWLLTRRGLGASNLFEAGAMLSTAGADRPDIQIECVAMRAEFGRDRISVEPGYQCFLSLQRPTSTGRVWLNSADPNANPAFRFNYLTTDYDQHLAVTAIRHLRDIMAQPSLDQRIKSEIGAQANLRSDADLLAFAKSAAESNYHPSCTLRMGPEGAVNATGLVHTLDNVRVIDASIFPTIPSANLNAPTIMLAEKIAATMSKLH